MKTESEEFKLNGINVKGVSSHYDTETLQKRRTTDELSGNGLGQEALILTPVTPLSQLIQEFNWLKIAKKGCSSEMRIIKSCFEAFLTLNKSLKTGLFTNLENFDRESRIGNMSSQFFVDQTMKSFLA